MACIWVWTQGYAESGHCLLYLFKCAFRSWAGWGLSLVGQILQVYIGEMPRKGGCQLQCNDFLIGCTVKGLECTSKVPSGVTHDTLDNTPMCNNAWLQPTQKVPQTCSVKLLSKVVQFSKSSDA